MGLIVSMVMLICACQNNKSYSKMDNDKHQEVDAFFKRGEKVTNDNFTGTVYVDMMVKDDTVYNTQMGYVLFEPGARTRWHSHPGGQLLVVTDGVGYYQEEGKPIRVLHKGDVVECPPNIVHWHGATGDSMFAHIAISTNTKAGPVKWLQKVTDQEYSSYK